ATSSSSITLPHPPRSTLFPYTTLFRSGVSGLLVRAEPQGHAGPHRRGQAGLPAQAGAHLAERAGRVPRRRGARPAQLPDRAPPVPEHAGAQPAQGAADRAALLRGDRRQLSGDRAVLLVRAGAAAPAPGGGRTALTRPLTHRSAGAAGSRGVPPARR